MHQDWHSDIRTENIKKAAIQFWTVHQKKALFYRQLAVMLKSGISIITAFRQLKNQSIANEIVDNILVHIEKGDTLSSAMEKSGETFSIFEIRTISAGEISGNLAELCEKLASFFETLQDVKYRLISGMVYPAILLHAAIIIPAIPLIFTKSIFAFFARILPVFILIYGIAFAIYVLYKFFSSTQMQNIRDAFLLKAPAGFGRLIQKISVLRFLQAFGCLYSAGVPVIEALKIAAKTSGNTIIENDLMKTAELVQQGSSLSAAISTNIFLPPVVKELMETGEQTGTLDEASEKAAWHLQQEVNFAVESILKIIPVVVYLLVALYVAFIVISFYSNYFSMINSLLE